MNFVFVKRLSIAAILGSAIAFSTAGASEAAKIKFMMWANNTNNPNTQYKVNFDGIGNSASSLYVKSIVYDLRAFSGETDAVWKNPIRNPIRLVSTGSGFAPAGITDFQRLESHSKLKISFADNAFTTHRSFVWQAVTQNLGNNSGGAFGSRKTSVTVNWSDGSSNTSVFAQQPGYATDSIADVPEPNAILATLIAIAFGGAFYRQSKTNQEISVS